MNNKESFKLNPTEILLFKRGFTYEFDQLKF